MWPGRAPAGWLLALLLPLLTVQSSALTVYGKLGGEVSFPKTGFNVTIKEITWKEGPHIAIQWDGKVLDLNRHYKERGRLNTTTGVMTITGLELSDTKVYTPYINDKQCDPIDLKVISAVPVPTVSHTCDKDTTSCNLTCDANTTEAEPVTYVWKFDDVTQTPTKSLTIHKDTNSNITKFSCELRNPVSSASSQPIANPLKTATGGLNVPLGLIVFLSLLSAVVLLVVVHRLKAGMCFYEKESMPWEADFWKRETTHAAGPNGTVTPPQQTPSSEETWLRDS